MKYAVMTTKHHEGFCMFDSQYTDYKCTNTRAGRDLIREYVDALDFSSADAILEMLNGYRIPETEKQTYERVRDMVMQLDHDGLMELLG